ncbi:hypothetical protein INR49_002007, partial [Caranx melampygus]
STLRGSGEDRASVVRVLPEAEGCRDRGTEGDTGSLTCYRIRDCWEEEEGCRGWDFGEGGVGRATLKRNHPDQDQRSTLHFNYTGRSSCGRKLDTSTCSHSDLNI